MAIRKDITITVKEDKAAANEKMFIYRGDVGVDFYLAITSLKVSFSSNTRETTNLLAELVNAYADITVLTPLGNILEIASSPKYQVVDDKVKFTITKEFTDELSDVGEYKLQIHLYDGDGTGEVPNRITIPPIDFEVKDYFK